MPQLKRTLVAWGTNESGLATLILRLLSHMAKIFPIKMAMPMAPFIR